MMNRLILCFSLCFTLSLTSEAQYSIPDPAFASALQFFVPNAMSGNVLDTNHVDVTSLTLMGVAAQGISDLSGIQFFDSLEELYCNDNQLTSLPTLPASLLELRCDNNQLTSLPSLPSTMEDLRCEGNQLTILPPLPTSLEVLWCFSNQLASIPPLPASLEFLECFDNQLTSLPVLPASLMFLICYDNQLTSLPALPASLDRLVCNDNVLTSLPTLPASLEWLYCHNNQLTNLPVLPTSVVRLHCYNNQLNCLPSLPGALDMLQCQGNVINCLPNFPVDLPPFGTGWNESNLGTASVLCSTSDPCFPMGVIAGTIFNDVNGNGVKEPGEGPTSFTLVGAQPGNYLGGVDMIGSYALPVDTGSYTAQGQPLLYHNITTPPHAVTITSGMSDTANHIGYQIIPGVYDLVVDIQTGVTRPGFDNNIWLEVRNIGTEPTTAAVDLDFDADQTFVSASVTPASQIGTNVNWSVPLNSGDVWNATVTLNTSTSVLLGTAVDHMFAAIPTSIDTTPADNSANWTDVVVGSYDPNDKTADAAGLTPTQVINGEWIEYLIRFQNTGTFLAEHVRITDTLSSDLQWGSFEYISSSHDNYWYLSNGTLVFQFDNIQLPDSNTNEPDSHGFVKFQMKPDAGLVLGDSIVNVANIYFDFNAPIITEPSVVHIDESIGIQEPSGNDFLIYPNPTDGLLRINASEPIDRLTVRSVDGRLVSSEWVASSTHLTDLSLLRPGIYFVELFLNEQMVIKRVVLE